MPSGTFLTRDGRYVIIGGNGDSVYTRLMQGIGHPEMDGSNAGYTNNSERMERETEIMSAIATWVSSRSVGTQPF